MNSQQAQFEKQLIELIGNRLTSRLSDVQRYLVQGKCALAFQVFSELRDFIYQSEMTYHLAFDRLDLFLVSLRLGPLQHSLHLLDGDVESNIQDVLGQVYSGIQLALSDIDLIINTELQKEAA